MNKSKKEKINKYFLSFIFLLSILFVFFPMQTEKNIYKYTPSTDGPIVRLPLLELTPDNFKLAMRCDVPKNNWILRTSGGPALLIENNENNLVVTTGVANSDKLYQNKFLNTFNQQDDQNCSVVLDFIDLKNILVLKKNTYSATIQLQDSIKFYFSSHIQWNEAIPSEGSSLQVETKKLVHIKNSLMRTLFGILLLVLIIIQFTKTTIINYSLPKIDLRYLFYSIFYVAFISFLVFPFADDGLYLIESKVFKLTGELIQYQYPVPFPTGHLHALLNSVPFLFTDKFIFHRIIPAIMSIFLWLLIEYLLKFTKLTFELRQLLFILWTLTVFSFFISLRPEVYVATCLFYLLLYVVKVKKELQKSLPTSLVCSAIALSIHQSGFVVLAAAIPIFLYSIFHLKYLYLEVNKILLSLSFSFIIFFFFANPIVYFDRFSAFIGVKNWPQQFPGKFDWGYSPIYEYKRLFHIFNSTPIQIFYFLLLFFVILILSIDTIKNLISNNFNKDEFFYLKVIMISACFGLFLATSKWSGHYAALSPLIFFLIILYKKLLLNKFFIFTTVLLTIFVLLRPWKGGGTQTLYLVEKNIDYYFRLIEYHRLIVGIVIFLVLIVFLRSYVTTKNVTFLLFFIIFNLQLNQIFPSVLDTINSNQGWSFIKQVNPFSKYSKCGLYSDQIFSELIDSRNKYVIAYENYSYMPCLNPVLPKNGVWEYPNASSGGIPVWDQQRLAYEVVIERVACITSETRVFLEDTDRCIYTWTSRIPNMKLISSTKIAKSMFGS